MREVFEGENARSGTSCRPDYYEHNRQNDGSDVRNPLGPFERVIHLDNFKTSLNTFWHFWETADHRHWSQTAFDIKCSLRLLQWLARNQDFGQGPDSSLGVGPDFQHSKMYFFQESLTDTDTEWKTPRATDLFIFLGGGFNCWKILVKENALHPGTACCPVCLLLRDSVPWRTSPSTDSAGCQCLGCSPRFLPPSPTSSFCWLSRWRRCRLIHRIQWQQHCRKACSARHLWKQEATSTNCNPGIFRSLRQSKLWFDTIYLRTKVKRWTGKQHKMLLNPNYRLCKGWGQIWPWKVASGVIESFAFLITPEKETDPTRARRHTHHVLCALLPSKYHRAHDSGESTNLLGFLRVNRHRHTAIFASISRAFIRFGKIPVLAKKLERPPFCCEATPSHTTNPRAQPPIAPLIIPLELSRPQFIVRVMGTTAEPIRTPMKRYTHPRLTWGKPRKLWEGTRVFTPFRRYLSGDFFLFVKAQAKEGNFTLL